MFFELTTLFFIVFLLAIAHNVSLSLNKLKELSFSINEMLLKIYLKMISNDNNFPDNEDTIPRILYEESLDEITEEYSLDETLRKDFSEITFSSLKISEDNYSDTK